MLPRSFLSSKPRRRTVLVFAVVMLALIGAVDAVTGTAVRILAFYYIPLGSLAWFVGRRTAVSGAFVCALAWLLANGSGFESGAVVIWNTLVTLAAFVSFSWVLGLLREDRDRLHHLATEDELTGLLNRRAFVATLEEEIRRSTRSREPLAVAFLDIDGFKSLNDTRGHKVGDMALQLVAKTMARRVRATDAVGRLGGDEFVILFREASEGAARTAMESVVARLNGAVAKRNLRIGFSVGIVSYDVPPQAADEVLQDADALMYEAKMSGKNRIVSKTGSPRRESRGENKIGRAIKPSS